MHITNRRVRILTVDRWQKQFDTVLIASSMRSAPRKKSRLKRLSIVCKLLIGVVCQNKAYKEKAGVESEKVNTKKTSHAFYYYTRQEETQK